MVHLSPTERSQRKRQEYNRRKFIAYVLSFDEKLDKPSFFNLLKENIRVVRTLSLDIVNHAIEYTKRHLSTEEREILNLKYRLDGEVIIYSYRDIAEVYEKDKEDIIGLQRQGIKRIRPYLEAIVSLP